MATTWLPEQASVTVGPRPGTECGTTIAGVGVGVPPTRVENAAIAARLGVDAEWISRRTGIQRRPIAAEGETLLDYGVIAAHDALGRAGIASTEVDLVLFATTTPDQRLPNMAPLLAHRIGADGAGAFDLGAACTGFISALAVACAQIESGRAECVLVVGGDLMSRVIDPLDRTTAALFGDAAGAAVIVATGPGGGIGPVILGSDGAGAELIAIEHGGTVQMKGPDTFRAAVARLAQASCEAVAVAGVELSEIDLFVYHQANGRILTAVGEQLGLGPGRVLDCIAEYGNTSAATLPLALWHAQQSGRLRPGTRVLLGAFGAGFTWGATVLTWEER